ncbi:MAG: hypothetical protein KJS92_09470, partial [Bacteroidetes bacterium]|nr:hypothetical protein [Bacteroidota bacterium]
MMRKVAKVGFAWFCSLSVLSVQAQVPGCTDPLASNYNPAATKNNGSCTYAAASVGSEASFRLPDSLAESSGLLLHQGFLWTHNDDTDPSLYFWKPDVTPAPLRKTISGVRNNDWEDLTRDEQYFYIGDFGNNGSGNRRNLNILRISDPYKQGSLLWADTISFTYEDQTDFTAQPGNSTDFDCEAFIAAGDSLYLFTKQWLSQKTACYVLPKTPGNHVARLRAILDVQGLITGASFLPGKSLVLFCGYSKTVQPFLYLLYDFDGNNFFSGNKRKISLDLSFHQIEGISTLNGLDVYMSNEQLKQFITIAPQVHRLDLRPFLSGYLGSTRRLIFEDPFTAIRVYTSGEMLHI